MLVATATERIGRSESYTLVICDEYAYYEPALQVSIDGSLSLLHKEKYLFQRLSVKAIYLRKNQFRQKKKADYTGALYLIVGLILWQ